MSDKTSTALGALMVSHSNLLGQPDGVVQLILASQSPRRREILDMMGLSGKYDATPSPLDESNLQQDLRSRETPVTPIEYTRILAEEKARALAETLTLQPGSSPILVLGSDTIVDLDGTILEKPVDKEDAVATLARLSGKQHYVHTGVALFSVKLSEDGSETECCKASSFVDTATVTFADLSAADIEAYVSSGEPMDKAGSYGIQGIGGQLVERVEGDFFTVMGLPMHRVSRALAEAVKAHAEKE